MLKLGGLADPDETSNVITVEEAAELSGLSEQTVRRRCSTGDIKANKVGKQWLIHASDFEANYPKRQRSSSTSKSSQVDYLKAVTHVRRHDLTELWVPDVLRHQDHISEPSSITTEAQRRVQANAFGSATQILVPKTLYSNRPGTNIELPDRVAYQAVVASFADKLDERLPSAVYSSRLSRDPKYFLAHSGKAYKRFKDAVPEHFKQDPTLNWVGSTDVTAYFDNILHSVLFEELVHAGASGEPLRALRVMLSKWSQVPGLGLPQGPNVSRVLGNFYLSPVDEEMTQDASIVYLRYMDDVRILAATKVEAVAGLRKFEKLCRERGLTLSSAKTLVESIEEFNKNNKDGRLDRIASLFDQNAITKSRPELKKLLKGALGENSINVRHARFSIWRLAKIRETGVLSRVLAKLEILAPVASPVAAYLRIFINRDHVQRRITEFLEDPARSYSFYLRSWVYAAMLEAKSISPEWRSLAEADAKDRNNPLHLRAVSCCVLGKSRNPRAIAWLKGEVNSELDPEMVRGLLVALTYACALDKGTSTAASTKHPALQSTTNWLRGRRGLPSLLHPRQDIKVDLP